MSNVQQTQGFQILLEAEKDAEKIVLKARGYRTQRLKDAVVEAEREIEQLKTTKRSELDSHEASLGSSDAILAQDDADTDQAIRDTLAKFEAARETVVQKLLAAVADVQPVLHVNAATKRR